MFLCLSGWLSQMITRKSVQTSIPSGRCSSGWNFAHSSNVSQFRSVNSGQRRLPTAQSHQSPRRLRRGPVQTRVMSSRILSNSPRSWHGLRRQILRSDCSFTQPQRRLRLWVSRCMVSHLVFPMPPIMPNGRNGGLLSPLGLQMTAASSQSTILNLSQGYSAG